MQLQKKVANKVIAFLITIVVVLVVRGNSSNDPANIIIRSNNHNIILNFSYFFLFIFRFSLPLLLMTGVAGLRDDYLSGGKRINFGGLYKDTKHRLVLMLLQFVNLLRLIFVHTYMLAHR